ncbi:MAG TPA: endonuclease Q family protein [Candidatus Pacearchaeota archaeon]|nr:endonuclease Q family protein [Candidatus Pacearchaeota archaeon]
MVEIIKGVFADLHIHSRFSRACSKDITIENLEKWGKIKGLGLIGTGDFTHPLWLKELKENLEEKNGILYSKNGFKFILTGEISLMYTQGRGRRVHLVLLVPNFEIADKINSYLDTKGRRDYDGRPIFKISCEQFARDLREISDKIEIIPAHVWTPWFGIFGSSTGFDSLKEAFGNEEKNIHAIETGMSSNPEMNWHLSELNNKAIVSFSDSHSFWPWRMGREATIFEKIESFQDIINAIRENKILGTIETEPAYGKYHWDGHIDCNFSSPPEETKKINGICPICGKPLVIGVANRVNEIGNQDITKNINKKKYYTLLPLHELIAFAISSKLENKKTWEIYNNLIEKFENEFNILLNVSKENLINELKDNEKLVKLILENREGKIKVKPGYDGKYGEMIGGEKQVKLF